MAEAPVAPASAIRAWREHPELFVRQVLGYDTSIEPWQSRVFDGWGSSQQRVAIRACKGPGKTWVEACCALQFLTCYPDSKVAATSVTADNLHDNLWTELAKLIKRSRLLEAMWEWRGEQVRSRQHPETWWISARTWSRDANPEQQGQTLAGLHADYIAGIVDEVGSIPDAVVKTIEAVLANAEQGSGRVAKLLIGGNPDLAEGPLYRACTIDRALWHVTEVTGDPDSPIRSRRVSLDWAREMVAKYGKDDPWVRVNVFGEFPDQQSDKLLGLETIREAMGRVVESKDYSWAPRQMGVDVARFGDDRSVIFARQGLVAFPPEVFRGLDTMELVAQVARSAQRFNPRQIAVDVTGVGAGVVDRLREMGFPVVAVNFGAKPLDPRFAEKRSEMWWRMCDWIRVGGALPNIPELISDLVGPRFSYATGKFKLERKDEMKRRGLPSPDLADALCCTFAYYLAPARSWTVDEHGNLVPSTEDKTLHDYDPYSSERVA